MGLCEHECHLHAAPLGLNIATCGIAVSSGSAQLNTFEKKISQRSLSEDSFGYCTLGKKDKRMRSALVTALQKKEVKAAKKAACLSGKVKAFLSSLC